MCKQTCVQGLGELDLGVSKVCFSKAFVPDFWRLLRQRKAESVWLQSSREYGPQTFKRMNGNN